MAVKFYCSSNFEITKEEEEEFLDLEDFKDDLDNVIHKRLFQSQVNDGICDCCSGVDESEPGLCQDVCQQQKLDFITKYETQRSIETEGMRIRRKWIKEAKKSYAGNLTLQMKNKTGKLR